MHLKRIVLGGVAAGIVMNVLDAITNGILMLAELQQNSVRLGLNPAAAETPLGFITLGAIDFVFGLVLVWLYAAMGPTYGPGWRTALRSAAAVFLSTMGILIGFELMGVLTPTLLIQMALAGAVTLAAGAIAGARVYGFRTSPAAS